MRNDALHIIVFEEDGMATQGYGADAAAAVVSHYDEMDMYCSPQDPDMREEFSVSVYTIPEDIEEAVVAAIEDLDGDELCGYIEALAAKNLTVRSNPVDVIYTMEGATAVVR